MCIKGIECAPVCVRVFLKYPKPARSQRQCRRQRNATVDHHARHRGSSVKGRHNPSPGPAGPSQADKTDRGIAGLLIGSD